MSLIVLALIAAIFVSLVLFLLVYLDGDLFFFHIATFVVASIAWGIYAGYMFLGYESEYETWLCILDFAVIPTVLWLALTLWLTIWLTPVGLGGSLILAGLGCWQMEDNFGFSGTELDVFRALAVFCIVLYLSMGASMMASDS